MIIQKGTSAVPIKFFVLVFALSIPFWILGYVATDLTKILPIKLPISALIWYHYNGCNPLIARNLLLFSCAKGYDGRFCGERLNTSGWNLRLIYHLINSK